MIFLLVLVLPTARTSAGQMSWIEIASYVVGLTISLAALRTLVDMEVS